MAMAMLDCARCRLWLLRRDRRAACSLSERIRDAAGEGERCSALLRGARARTLARSRARVRRLLQELATTDRRPRRSLPRLGVQLPRLSAVHGAVRRRRLLPGTVDRGPTSVA